VKTNRDQQLRRLFVRSTTRTAVGALRIWLTVALAWTVAINWWQPWILTVAVLFIGTMQYHMNVLGHDGLHFLLSPNRNLNDFICRWILHGPHCAPLTILRKNHLHHHATLGDATDLDRQYYEIAGFSSGPVFVFWLAASCLGAMSVAIIAKLFRRLVGAESLATYKVVSATPWVDFIAVFASQSWIFSLLYWGSGRWYAYFLLWVLPLLTVMMGLNVIRSCLEHADDTGIDNPTRNFSFLSSPIECFFIAPFNMNIHAEHHHTSAVPWFNLPKLRRYLQRSGHYGSIRLCRSYLERVWAIARFLDGQSRRDRSSSISAASVKNLSGK
jgi:fatty acid desaturase